ncbi:repetitive proline-rich cell wall protein isoform X3 [Eurytemora carolleeae]|uniref:repetitive proline-rich cell wall protein isoform X3 n=1 Tax=Eurytemora carolleeae TaxID=1294199 RepID=UPI000C779DBB|nr:repetitive proline-rich cell wall protein isoform X3 [Eurytemora carolleeae]|eukprot:XP_023325647.1 repetitive proline-rich cell wall protein-like isoform X3 [Eurytemora affinis]
MRLRSELLCLGLLPVIHAMGSFLMRASLHPPHHIKQPSAHSSSGIHPPYSLGIHQPGIHKPGIHQPGTQKPGIHQPGIHQPGIHQPGIHQPGTHKPGIHQPGIHQPGIHQPGEQSHFVHPIRPPVPGIRQPGEIKKMFEDGPLSFNLGPLRIRHIPDREILSKPPFVEPSSEPGPLSFRIGPIFFKQNKDPGFDPVTCCTRLEARCEFMFDCTDFI